MTTIIRYQSDPNVFPTSILWKIQKEDGPISYLQGTYHVFTIDAPQISMQLMLECDAFLMENVKEDQEFQKILKNRKRKMDEQFLVKAFNSNLLVVGIECQNTLNEHSKHYYKFAISKQSSHDYFVRFRNKLFLPTIMMYLERPSFIAVGVFHLPELIFEIKKAGYQVTEISNYELDKTLEKMKNHYYYGNQ